MTAQIIPFDIRRSPEWPDGELGEALEGLAREVVNSASRRGKEVPLERARRAALAALKSELCPGREP